MKQSTEFQSIVRGVPLHVEAFALGDQYGIYSLSIAAFIDGAEVTGLLTDDDLMQLDSEALKAFAADHSEQLTTKGY